MNCPDCGAYIGEKDMFCGECGRPIQREPASEENLRPEDVKDQATEVLAPPASLRPEDVKDQATEVLDSPPPAPAGQPAPPVGPAKPARVGKKPSRGIVLGLGGLIAGVLCLCLAGVAALLAFGGDTTPTAVASTAVPDVVVYQDDFEDPESGWDVYNYGDTLALYQDGEYRLGVFRTDYVAWGNPEPVQDLGDFEIEVDARAVEGPLDNNLGLLVRYQEDHENFYWFQISSDGLFSVDRLEGGEWVTVVNWQESTAIQQGLGVTNRLKVVCSGDQFTFYVNDTWLETVTDDTFASGNIGLAAGTFEEPGVVVHFDNLKVRRPGK